jgi:hypothetical protein
MFKFLIFSKLIQILTKLLETEISVLLKDWL